MLARLLLLLTCINGLNLAAQSPDLSAYTITSAPSLKFSYNNCFLNRSCYTKQAFTKTEIPPLIISDAGTQHYFFVDGRKSVVWPSIIQPSEKGKLDLKNGSKRPFTVTSPYIHEADFDPTKAVLDWKRNYHAIYSGHLLQQRDGSRLFIGFCHGENKNEVAAPTCTEATGSQLIQNTIQPNVRINCPDSTTLPTFFAPRKSFINTSFDIRYVE